MRATRTGIVARFLVAPLATTRLADVTSESPLDLRRLRMAYHSRFARIGTKPQPSRECNIDHESVRLNVIHFEIPRLRPDSCDDTSAGGATDRLCRRKVRVRQIRGNEAAATSTDLWFRLPCGIPGKPRGDRVIGGNTAKDIRVHRSDGMAVDQNVHDVIVRIG